MTIPIDELKEAHRFSFRNASRIKDSTRCGCFFCKTIIDSSDVTEFHKESKQVAGEDTHTGFCCLCGIDSLIPDNVGIAITDELLERMNEVYFLNM